MNTEFTPEKCYNIYYKAINSYKGRNVKALTDFTKQKERPEWKEFISFARMCNKGFVDPDLYIQSLLTNGDGYIDLLKLCSPNSIKIYKSYIVVSQHDSSDEFIFKELAKSINFVATTGVNSIEEYLMIDIHGGVPQIARDLHSGRISKYFFVAIPSVLDILRYNCYGDIYNEYFSEFEEKDFSTFRLRLLHSNCERVKTIVNNFSKIVAMKCCNTKK